MISGYSILNGTEYFAEDGSQIFIAPVYNTTVAVWKSKGFSDKIIIPTTSYFIFNPELIYTILTKLK